MLACGGLWGDYTVTSLQFSYNSAAPNKNFIESCGPKLRTAERTCREKLEFLYETPSFKPKIIHKVPDFKKMHRALQTETLWKSHDTEPTKLQPFLLRTSALPPRKRRVSPENTRVGLHPICSFFPTDNLLKYFIIYSWL